MSGTHSPVPVPAGRARIRTSAVLSLAATALTGVLWTIGWLPAMDRVSGDVLVRAGGARETTAVPVAAVLIDDAAVARFGPLPWPRERLAAVVDAVRTAGAHAVVIDLVLAEPGEPEGDAALARALNGVPAALAAALDREGQWLLPLPGFGGRDAAAHAYGEVGPDGVVRTFAATKQAGNLSLPALSLAAARLLRPAIPVTPGDELRPGFRPAPQNLPAFSAAAAIDDTIPGDRIRGALVFLGVSATGAGDQFVVPTGPGHAPVAGVLAHASATASILDGRMLKRLDARWSLAAALLLGFGVQILRDRRGAFDLLRFSIVLAGVGAIAVLAAQYLQVLVPIAAFVVAMVISALLREALESRLAHRETGRLLQTILTHSDASQPGSVPRSARDRLDAIRKIQQRVFFEDATRRALLAGMAEGIVLWDAAGNVLEANPAARRLWGGLPEMEELVGQIAENDGDSIRIRRGSYDLSLAVTDLDSNLLVIIRDVTAEITLEKKRREMQRLVSHELKTPLASIAGLGETLERYQLSGDELSRVAAMIRGEAVRLQDMVTVFLDLERLGAGHWNGEAETIDFASQVRSRLEVLEAAAAAHDLSVSTSTEDGCLTTAVPSLLDRVVDNLVGNAIKYSAPGDRIEVEVRREEHQVLMTVRDHGPGIPRESLDRIFERFYRVPGTRGAGAGLGLSLVKDIVDWHGGCITIDTEPGAGSAFTVSLPALEED